MPTGTFTLVQTFTTICCPTSTCGVTFAINDEYRDRRVEDHKDFYCPNGHYMSYGHKTAAEKRADRLQKALNTRDEDLRLEQQRLAAERKRHTATKGQLTKARKRAEHAMCPVDGCRRSFANVARHIERQHPEFAPA